MAREYSRYTIDKITLLQLIEFWLIIDYTHLSYSIYHISHVNYLIYLMYVQMFNKLILTIYRLKN